MVTWRLATRTGPLAPIASDSRRQVRKGHDDVVVNFERDFEPDDDVVDFDTLDAATTVVLAQTSVSRS